MISFNSRAMAQVPGRRLSVVASGRFYGSSRPQARLLKVELVLYAAVQLLCDLCGAHLVLATLVTLLLHPACGARSRLHEHGLWS